MNCFFFFFCFFQPQPEEPVPVIETEVLPEDPVPADPIEPRQFQPEYEDRIETEVLDEPPELPPPPPGQTNNSRFIDYRKWPHPNYIMAEMIYRSLVESILTFNIGIFYGHLTVKQKNRLNKIVNIATKLKNLKQKSLNDLYQQAISKKSRSIINDPTHPLYSCYEIMPSGKRYRTPAFKRQLYNKSFIPSAVRFLNSQKNL